MIFKCGLDPFCYVWATWLGLPFPVQALVVAAIVLLVGGAVWNFTTLAKAIAGWPGVAAVGALLTAIVVGLGMWANRSTAPLREPPEARRGPFQPPTPKPRRSRPIGQGSISGTVPESLTHG